MSARRHKTIVLQVGVPHAFYIVEDYDTVRALIDDIKADQEPDSNPFAAPLIGITLILGEDVEPTRGCINALNVSAIYAVPEDTSE